MTENDERYRKVNVTVDVNERKRKGDYIGFNAYNFVRDPEKPTGNPNTTANVPQEKFPNYSENQNVNVQYGMMGFQAFKPDIQEAMQELYLKMMIQTVGTKDEILDDLYQKNLLLKSNMQYPESIFQNEKGLIYIKPKKQGGYMMTPVADVRCRCVQQIQYVQNETAEVVNKEFLITIVKSNNDVVEFCLTEAEMEQTNLVAKIQRQIDVPIYLSGKNMNQGTLLKNFIYDESLKYPAIIKPIKPGFYLDLDKKIGFSYGKGENTTDKFCDSEFTKREGIQADYIFDQIEDVYNMISGETVKILLFSMMLNGVISSWTVNRFKGRVPLFVFQCKTEKEANLVNAYVGGIFKLIKSHDKNLEATLQRCRDGVACICFVPESSKYYNELTKERMLKLQEGSRRQMITAELLLVNIGNSAYFDEDVISETFTLTELPDVKKVTDIIQAFLQMFVEWILDNQELVWNYIAEFEGDSFEDCWWCVQNIAAKFLGEHNRRLPKFVESTSCLLEELLDVDPLDSFENLMEELWDKLIDEVRQGNSMLTVERDRRKFIVDTEEGYRKNLYLYGDHVYINIEYFNTLAKEVAGSGEKANQLIRYMAEAQIIENYESIRGNKISVTTKAKEELTRLNVWKIKKSFLGDTVLNMIGG